MRDNGEGAPFLYFFGNLHKNGHGNMKRRKGKEAMRKGQIARFTKTL